MIQIMVIDDPTTVSGAQLAGPWREVIELGSIGGLRRHLVLHEGDSTGEVPAILWWPRGSVLEDHEVVDMWLDASRSAIDDRAESLGRIIEVNHYGGVPIVVTEWIDGVSMQKLLTAVEHGQVEASSAMWLTVLAGVAAELLPSHRRGQAHLGVRPDLVTLTWDGLVVVEGFGSWPLARRAAGSESGIDRSYAAYVSPQQLEGERGGPSSDVFAVAGLVFTCIAGMAPWSDLGARLRGAEPRRLADLVPDIPEEIDALCTRALGEEAGRPHIEELAVALDRHGTSLEPLLDDLREVFAETRQSHGDLGLVPPVPAVQTGEGLPRLSTPESVPPEPTSVTIVPPHVAPEPPRRRFDPVMLAALGVAAFGAAFVARGVIDPAPEPLAPAVTPSTPPAMPATIVLQVVARPPGAHVRVDGEPIGTSPARTELVAGEEVHTIEVQAPGHATETRRLSFSRSTTIQVSLAPLEESPPSPAED